MIKQKSDFLIHAEEAATAEREGRYGEALEKWRLAKHYANKSANAEWASHRADFCARVLFRPF